jgi:flagellar biosynthetic protein FliO
VTAPEVHGATYYLLQALVSLAVVVGLICASYFVLRRFQGQPSRGGGAGQIEVLDSRSLGGGRWLYLVRIGDEQYLVGGSASGVGPIELTGAPPKREDEGTEDAQAQQ